MPIDGCPPGFQWDPFLEECVEEYPQPEPTSDINPSSITWNSQQSYFTGVETIYNRSVKKKITPGSTINGISYVKAEIYINNNATGEKLIIGSQHISSSHFIDYHDIYGNFIGRMETLEDEFQSFTPGWSGSIDGSDYIAQGFFGRWGDCVARVLDDMAGGTVIGSTAAILCIYMGPECAATIAVVCAISALIS